MVMTDPIADMLTRIRNALQARHERVDIPASKVKREIAEILKSEGFIREYRVLEDRKQGVLRIYLKYGPEGQPVIAGLRRVSRPGLRIYAPRRKLPRVLRGLGIAIISTPKGMMTDRRARLAGVGGEVICYVW